MAEFWREPIKDAKPQHVGGVPEIPGLPRIAWLIDPENMAWLLQAKGCVVCLTKFPERPTKNTVHHFLGIEYGRPWSEVKRLIQEEKCPACKSDVSPDMARALLVRDVWTNPAKPGAIPA